MRNDKITVVDLSPQTSENKQGIEDIYSWFEYGIGAFNYGDEIASDLEVLPDLIREKAQTGKDFVILIEQLRKATETIKIEDSEASFPGQVLKSIVIFFVLNIRNFHNFNFGQPVSEEDQKEMHAYLMQPEIKDEIIDGVMKSLKERRTQKPNSRPSGEFGGAINFLSGAITDEELFQTCDNLQYLLEESNDLDLQDQEIIQEGIDITRG